MAYLPGCLPACLSLQVDVVGVDGELRDVALRAINTRANFAYSQKEVGGRCWEGRSGGENATHVVTLQLPV